MKKHNELNEEVIELEDGKTVIQCEMCEQYYKTEYQGKAVGKYYPFAERGSQMTITGGYGEFVDLTRIEILLCHDCTLKIVRMIPKLHNLQGMHSVSIYDESYPLCCEYSWTTDDESDERDEYGNRPTIYGTKENFKPQKSYEVTANYYSWWNENVATQANSQSEENNNA